MDGDNARALSPSIYFSLIFIVKLPSPITETSPNPKP